MIDIDSGGDLIIRITHNDDAHAQTEDRSEPVEFRVKRSVIFRYSQPLARLILHDLRNKEGSQVFHMMELSPISMEIWFRAFHDTMTSSSHLVDIKELWNSSGT